MTLAGAFSSSWAGMLCKTSAEPTVICKVFATFLQNLSFFLPAVSVGTAWAQLTFGSILTIRGCLAVTCSPCSSHLMPSLRVKAAVPLAITKVNAALWLAWPGTATKPAEIGGLWKMQCHCVALLLVPVWKAAMEAWCPHAALQASPRIYLPSLISLERVMMFCPFSSFGCCCSSLRWIPQSAASDCISVREPLIVFDSV